MSYAYHSQYVRPGSKLSLSKQRVQRPPRSKKNMISIANVVRGVVVLGAPVLLACMAVVR